MKKVFLVYIVLVFFVPSLYSQSAEELEKQYRSLNPSIREEQAVLDSLNGLMEKTAKDIEREKKNAASDQNKIVKWMAHAVTISNQIKEQEKKAASVQFSAENCRNLLEELYSRIIDSLKQEERTGKYDGDKKVLQNQLLFWTERRVLVSPLVATLTFDPQKVQGISLTGISDPLDKTIIEDYLQRALNEIETHIQLVTAQRIELEEITDLRKRTLDFVNEANEQGHIGSITRSQIVSSGGTENPLDPDYKTFQVKSLVGLIQQLNTGLMMTQAFQKPISSKPGLTQEEYIQLLKQAEKQLKTYREMVQKKLK
ncbi:hypothetical protein JNL27_04815 [bacterium]|nr:hypothetical protein [bacterium]